MLSVNHNINRRRYDSGMPFKRVTLAQLSTKEKMVERKEAEIDQKIARINLVGMYADDALPLLGPGDIAYTDDHNRVKRVVNMYRSEA